MGYGHLPAGRWLAEFRIQPGDALVVAGADEDIATFSELAGVSPE